MTQFLPPNLLALFAPRDPIPYLQPPDKLPHEKKNVHNYHGMAIFVANNFENPADTPPPTKVEMREERIERKRREKEEQETYKLEQKIALWDPQSNPEGTTDPFRTLFVSRINFYTSESKLKREFETYGPIKQIKIVSDTKNSGKPRGYCFIEFEQEKDMHSAYKHADGKKIDGRRVLVDVERARTVKGWLPRRLGGGLGGTRRGGPDVNVRHSGREEHRDRGSAGGGEGGGRRRSRSRDRAEGSRGGGGDRDRERRRRRSRSRSKERTKKRSRSRDRSRGEAGEKRERKRRSRSRGEAGEKREKREKKRSRSRDRKRSRRSRSRDGSGIKREGGAGGDDWARVKIKDEPEDHQGGDGGDADGYGDYPQDDNDYGRYNAHVKTEHDDREDRKPFANGGEDDEY